MPIGTVELGHDSKMIKSSPPPPIAKPKTYALYLGCYCYKSKYEGANSSLKLEKSPAILEPMCLSVRVCSEAEIDEPLL